MSRPEYGTIVLEGAGWEAPAGSSLVFRGPCTVLQTDQIAEVVDVLREVDAAVAGGQWVAGYLAYEAGWAFVPRPANPPVSEGKPILWLGLYDEPPQLVRDGEFSGLVSGEAFRLHPGNLRWNREDHAAAVDRVKHHIHEGDVYQINLTHSYDFEVGGSYAAFYRALRSRQTAGFSAYLDTGKRRIISHSPELFFRRRGDLLQARPMKGTAVRSETDTVHDRRWLAEDAKNRAENLMIVDLLRNDLSACCLPGSVRVKDLFHVESYETLYQMTSTIEGRLRPSISNSEIVRALFPCGSVTGAPKIRAMHLIADIEREPRGVYCGAIGFVSPERIAMFSVAIRTAEVDSDSGRGTIGTGSGIVWDSESRGEYDEGVLKLRFLTSVQE